MCVVCRVKVRVLKIDPDLMCGQMAFDRKYVCVCAAGGRSAVPARMNEIPIETHYSYAFGVDRVCVFVSG